MNTLQSKNVQRRLKTIKERNEAFRALPKREQRIAIAKDVLKQLRAEKYLPTSGVYEEFSDDADTTSFFQGDTQLALRTADVPSCRCCAVGAAFLSAIRLQGGGNLCDSEWSFLKPFFSAEELNIIEATFEGWEREECLSLRHRQFIDDHPDSSERLKAIFKYIAKHGSFIS